jgi:hypothetical protein
MEKVVDLKFGIKGQQDHQVVVQLKDELMNRASATDQELYIR